MIKPLGNRILIDLGSQEQMSSGGLVLAKAAQTKPTQGQVLALGSLVEERNAIAVGDTVVFSEHAGINITYENHEYLVIDVEDVFAVVE